MSDETALALNAAKQAGAPRVVVGGRDWQYYSGSSTLWEASDQDTKAAIRCGACAMPEFTIRFGRYECIATCARCGHEQVIYDG